jgi:hypothetical protein
MNVFLNYQPQGVGRSIESIGDNKMMIGWVEIVKMIAWVLCGGAAGMTVRIAVEMLRSRGKATMQEPPQSRITLHEFRAMETPSGIRNVRP